MKENDIRAIILATGYRAEMEPLMRYRPVPMLRIVDKPMIVHMIEFLADQGVKNFEIVLSHLPHKVEEVLQEGHRWGINIHYHLAKDASQPIAPLLPAAHEWSEESLLIARADTLPQFSLNTLLKAHETSKLPILLLYPSKEWTGWGIVPSKFLASLPPDTHEDDIINHLKPGEYHSEKGLPFLSVRTFKDWEKSNIKQIASKNPKVTLPMTARMLEPGVWISRGTILHPSVRIRGPVFIGEDCQIKQHTQIGPDVVIENNCVIDHKSIVQDSLICQKSYLGEGLEVKHAIVDRNVLVNLEWETRVVIYDDFILAELKPPSVRQYLLRSLGKYLAAFLILLFSPLLGLLYATRHLQKQQMIHLPAPLEEHRWKTFELLSFSREKNPPSHQPKGFLACLPMLFNILKGELHFTGVPPRTVKETAALPPDWQKLYLYSKAGLITLAMVEQISPSSPDELYASEAYYMVNSGLWYDIKLCLRWFFKG